MAETNDSLRARMAELEQALTAMTAERNFFREMVETNGDPLQRFDIEGQILYASPAFEKLLGYPTEEIVGTSGFDLMHPDDRHLAVSMREVMRAGAPGMSNFPPGASRLRHKDGHYLWVESAVALLRDADGNLREALLSSRDLTTRLHTEDALRASEQRFRALIDNLQVGVLVMAPTGQYVLWNQTALDMLGISVEQIRGDVPVDPRVYSIHEDGRACPPEDQPVVQAMRSGQPVRDVTIGMYSPSHDRIVWMLITAMPELDRDGKVLQVVCTLTDISARRAAEATIREQAALLDELSTPLIPISTAAMVMPLVGTVDARRGERILDALLTGISSYRAQIVILDITGVAQADTHFAGVLTRVTRAASLLGTEVIITGMRAQVAQTLVGLGADLLGVRSLASLQAGIQVALQREAQRSAG